MPMIVVDKERCKGCELCIEACPEKIIGLSKQINLRGYFFAQVPDSAKCIGCRVCAVACPDVAISVVMNGAQYRYFDY
jgi:2-oxoglutarate ferredoxin oxidoreductase subunit delta